MQNRSVWFVLGRRALYPIALAALFALVHTTCHAQEATPAPSPGEAEVESVVVSATRFDIPLDQSPASASVISSEELEQKQIQRVSDALREVPGLSVVQTGTAGQLTSVFTRGLRSEHTQVLLDGIPINQGLQGAFNFADLTTDDIDRIEIVRGPQSTLYCPRALAGVIQIFTKQGTGTPGVTVSAEGGSYDTFREALQSDGKIIISGAAARYSSTHFVVDRILPDGTLDPSFHYKDDAFSGTFEYFSNGVTALDKLRDGTYDLIISDLKMPHLDGRDSLVRWLAATRT